MSTVPGYTCPNMGPIPKTMLQLPDNQTSTALDIPVTPRIVIAGPRFEANHARRRPLRIRAAGATSLARMNCFTMCWRVTTKATVSIETGGHKPRLTRPPTTTNARRPEGQNYITFAIAQRRGHLPDVPNRYLEEDKPPRPILRVPQAPRFPRFRPTGSDPEVHKVRQILGSHLRLQTPVYETAKT